MKITGYKILSVLGMLILHSLPFLAYYLIDHEFDKVAITLILSILNIALVGMTGIYSNLFKREV